MKNIKYVLILIAIAFIAIFIGYRWQLNKSETLPESTRETQALKSSEETNEQEKKRLYVLKDGDFVKIRNKYSENQDIEISWGRNGANNLFDYRSTAFAENEEDYVSDLNIFTQAHSSTTDFFGPHKLMATNNGDGDFLDETQFTGGNHAFDGGSTGSPTAETIDVKLFVDGEEQDKFDGYADNVQIKWTNLVQASNTKKNDGSGRHVIEESYTLDFDGETYAVNNSIEFLEEVKWETYYGMQAYYGDFWNGDIIFSDKSEKVLDADDSNKSQALKTDKVILSKDSNVLEMGVDIDSGIGNRAHLNKTNAGAFNIGDSKKAYFWLVDGGEFTEGDVVELNGYYRFYSE